MNKFKVTRQSTSSIYPFWLYKEGSRMEGTLDFDFDDLGGSF